MNFRTIHQVEIALGWQTYLPLIVRREVAEKYGLTVADEPERTWTADRYGISVASIRDPGFVEQLLEAHRYEDEPNEDGKLAIPYSRIDYDDYVRVVPKMTVHVGDSSESRAALVDLLIGLSKEVTSHLNVRLRKFPAL